MSMCYWAIAGFGIEDIDTMISEDKIAQIHNDGEELFFHEYVETIYRENLFYFIDNGEGNYCYLYSPSMPFDLTEEEKKLESKEHIATLMYEELKDILVDGITVEDFKKRVDWVSTYGAG